MSLQKICSYHSLLMLDKICTDKYIKINQHYFLKQFNNLNIINRGGFGIVFRAHKNREKSEYAIKVVPFYINKKNHHNENS